MQSVFSTIFSTILLFSAFAGFAAGQDADAKKVQLGSETAKNGFRNEDEIRDKFNNWKTDKDARAWLKAMGYLLSDIKSVSAGKPHGFKSDVEVIVTTSKGKKVNGISIKLVSSDNGFNQIDKRWLKTYAKMWNMPADVVAALKLYVGETPPDRPSRDPRRMYLKEFEPETQKAVMDFFKKRKDEIVSDLLAGDGDHAAGWFMVTFKNTDTPRWCILSLADTIKFYAEGEVVMTRAGNLKIGRISMQRKGGDNGRETAKMLQFKINPADLFEAK